MKLVIHTQIKENYGAHDWDGKGECPQGWKFKGGNTYVVEDVDRYAGVCQPWMELTHLIEEFGDYWQEYAVSTQEVEDDVEPWDDYDVPIYCTRNGYGLWIAERANFYENQFEGITEAVNSMENWIMKAPARREDYMEYVA